ncbi:MAG: YtxH domain-containing protein [Nitrospirae bacterium]|nr:MAG: YtxH domain-containing protein [Nitrospirota bacterium]
MGFSNTKHHQVIIKKEGHPMAAEDSGFSSGAVAFAFLAGAIIGAGAALLLAPQTGAETRRLLRDYAEKAEEEIRERLPEAKAMLDSAIEKGKDLVEKGKDFVEKGKEFVDDQKSLLSSAMDAGRTAMKKHRAS